MTKLARFSRRGLFGRVAGVAAVAALPSRIADMPAVPVPPVVPDALPAATLRTFGTGTVTVQTFNFADLVICEPKVDFLKAAAEMQERLERTRHA